MERADREGKRMGILVSCKGATEMLNPDSWERLRGNQAGGWPAGDPAAGCEA